MRSRSRFTIALILAAALGGWLIWTSIGGSLETYTSPSGLVKSDGTTYRLNGKVYDYLPAHAADQAAVEPIYEEMPGWQETTAGARSWADLPAQAIKYISRVQELIETPVALVSTSPQREDTILVRDPFAD